MQVEPFRVEPWVASIASSNAPNLGSHCTCPQSSPPCCPIWMWMQLKEQENRAANSSSEEHSSQGQFDPSTLVYRVVRDADQALQVHVTPISGEWCIRQTNYLILVP